MEHKIKLTKTYRYFTFGNKDTADNVWIVLHGYGQLAYFFIKKFNALDPDKNFVIAPEGMHRFYLQGTNGRVGASWMTKEAREDDIQDNLDFLDEIYSTETKSTSFENQILLGFSQGGATAARWHANGKTKASHFILWASVFPPDLTLDMSKTTFKTSQNVLVVGENDPYYDLAKERQLLENLDFKMHYFDGEHNIPPHVLSEVKQTFID